MLGRTGLAVSPIGFGAWAIGGNRFGNSYGPTDDAESLRAVHRAYELGCNFFDTADVYGLGHNEQLVGRALRGKRDRALIATKFGNLRAPNGAFVGINGKPDYVRRACDASLARLGIDVIDLYYQHRVDPDTPIEDTVGALADLVRAGKVRRLGLSEAAPATVRRAHAVHPIAALQTEFSLWTREPAEETLGLCAELGITFVAYSPLGRGFLTGAFKSIDDLAPDDVRRNHPRFQGENFRRNRDLVHAVEELAGEKGVTAAQLALAWVLSQGEHIVPIPGTRSIQRLEENIAAAEIVLSDAERARLDRILPPAAVAGQRYPDAGMRAVGR